MKTKKELLDVMLNDPVYRKAAEGLPPEERRRVEEIISGDALNLIHRLQMAFLHVSGSPSLATDLLVSKSTGAVFKVDAAGEEHVSKQPE